MSLREASCINPTLILLILSVILFILSTLVSLILSLNPRSSMLNPQSSIPADRWVRCGAQAALIRAYSYDTRRSRQEEVRLRGGGAQRLVFKTTMNKLRTNYEQTMKDSQTNGGLRNFSPRTIAKPRTHLPLLALEEGWIWSDQGKTFRPRGATFSHDCNVIINRFDHT